MNQLSFRQATETDEQFLLELRIQTMSAHLRASGVNSTKVEHLSRVRAAFESALIILKAGEPVGMLKVEKEGQQWELVQIQLLPSVQGKGLGTNLLQSLVAEARYQCASLRLSVLKNNPAKHLYERLGFTVIAERTIAYEMGLRA